MAENDREWVIRMSYLGYRVIINGITVPDNLIAKGSWNMSKPKRIVSNWKDANQIEHEDVLPTRKVDIKFSIKRRTLSEQESIIGILGLQESVPVTYWDDYDCTYKTGTFKMDAVTFNHENTEYGDIRYTATPIHLTEY